MPAIEWLQGAASNGADWLRGLGRKGASSFAALIDASQMSFSGAHVTPQSALQVSAVLSCCRVISDGTAQCDLALFKEDANGDARPAGNHPLSKLIARPNAWMTPFDFVSGLVFLAALTGNGYAYISRRTDGSIRELIPMLDVTPKQNDRYILTYDAHLPTGEMVTLPQNAVLHLRGPSLDGFQGLSIVRLARESIGLSESLETSQAAFHKNGARPSGLLTSKTPLTEPQMQELRKAWDSVYAGARNSAKTAILSGEIDWKAMTVSAADSQTLESRRFQVLEVCRNFRVFPMLVFAGEGVAAFASVEAHLIAHVVHTISPWLHRLEQTCTLALLSRDDLEAGYFFRCDANALLRGAATDRAIYLATLRNLGVLSANEVRRMEGLPRIDDPAADTYLTPLNMGPVDTAKNAARPRLKAIS